MKANPFLERSSLEYELPPFSEIVDEDYRQGFYLGCKEQLEEIETIIKENRATFENTIVALERSGQTLKRTLLVFFNKSASDTNALIDEIEAEISPKLAAHQDSILLNPELFSRIRNLYETRERLDLDKDDLWLLERYYEDFLHAGAALSLESRERLKKINERLSELETKFGQQVLADTNDLAVLVENEEHLEGLSPNQIATAAAAAQARGCDGKWLIPIVNFTGHPLLANLKNRQLREEIMRASLLKGDRDNHNDTKLIIKEMVALRAERAALFGKSSHSEYVISRQTAKTPERVEAMMRKLAPAALANAKREAAELQDAIAKDSQDFQLASWDWSYYTEKVRQDKFQLDTAAMKPYFEIESVIFNGVFFAAEKLFGLKFLERPDLLAYHPQARVFEVFNEDGSKLGLYIADLYTRDSKRGGAWMNTLVDQSHLLGQFPVVVNNMNIPKPPVGEPTLLTYDETRTFFHEFGHALHGLLSSVKYPKFSGTSVERDFVEFPSQVNEMWMLWPEIVRNYARHYQTGEELPKSWIESLDLSESFNEGFATTSYLAAAVLDLALHSLPSSSNFDEVLSDLRAFESNVLSDYGLSFDPVPTRYRAMHFSHIFAGGYSAGYYGYIWSEVLDADTVEWFKSSGGLVRANGDHFRKTLLSKGGSLDSMEMYREFRGRDAVIEPLLKRRGLIES